jgi:adenylylsulfate kinase
VTDHNEQKGFTVWFTGLSGAGKSTLAEMLFHELRRRDMRVEVLDGDVVRTNLSKGLGFSREDRDTNILRIGFVANLLTRNGVATVVSAVSPYRDARAQCRSQIKDFVEVYVHATVDECAKRDVKGLYEKAMRGEITGFTGVNDPYEEPQSPEIYIDTMQEQPDGSLQKILDSLVEYGYIEHARRLVHAGGEHSGLTDLDGSIGNQLANQHSTSPTDSAPNGKQESPEPSR